MRINDIFRKICQADSRLAPSQRETSLQSNAVSHWLGANLESLPVYRRVSQLYMNAQWDITHQYNCTPVKMMFAVVVFVSVFAVCHSGNISCLSSKYIPGFIHTRIILDVSGGHYLVLFWPSHCKSFEDRAIDRNYVSPIFQCVAGTSLNDRVSE